VYIVALSLSYFIAYRGNLSYTVEEAKNVEKYVHTNVVTIHVSYRHKVYPKMVSPCYAYTLIWTLNFKKI